VRAILAADTLQIEWTSRCVLSCSDCTHFSGSYYEHPELSFDQFRKIVDSLEGYPNMIGAIGGDPVIHPEFETFCEYIRTKFPREQLGLWTTFPKGKEYYRDVICKTFGNILLNDHTMPGIMHAPILVGVEEVVEKDEDIWPIVDQCWLANHWSPVVNTKGAFFCEVAGSMAQLFQGSDGWTLEPGWWKRVPKDYGPQMEEFCRKCGCALPLARRQSHTPGGKDVDDISPKNLERLKGKSRKVDKGLVQISNFAMDQSLINPNTGAGAYPQQNYKDEAYRKGIAARYGIVLNLNKHGYWDPMLKENAPVSPEPPESLFKTLQREYAGG
jgi:hypothetical protein